MKVYKAETRIKLGFVEGACREVLAATYRIRIKIKSFIDNPYCCDQVSGLDLRPGCGTMSEDKWRVVARAAKSTLCHKYNMRFATPTVRNA
jgi:hypothetical protein